MAVLIPACLHCGHAHSTVSAPGRRRCKACGKSFPANGKYRRAPVPPVSTEACPSCGSTQVVRNGYKFNITTIKCKACGKRWNLGRNSIAAPIDGPAHDVQVYTCAVNDTPVHHGFLRALQGYIAARSGSLSVIPLRYKNPTSQQEDSADISWAKQVVPYLLDQRTRVCKGLQVLADIKTQPTAVSPLSSMDGLTGTDSCIIGHPRIAMEPVATRGHELPKIMLTTGAITRANYSATIAGSRGEFNHVIGAVVVEVDRKSGLFHLRHINATASGSFIDLDTEYLPDGTNRPAPPALALILGDGHAEQVDTQACQAAREQQALLKPKRLVWHDVHNHGSASHHSGLWERIARRVIGQDRVLDELRTTAALVDSFHRTGQDTVIVSSNHHDHLSRWLADHRNGEDVQNAGIYHKAKSAVIEYIERHKSVPDIFGLILRPMLKHPARFLTERDSYSVAGIELAYHGDKGPNGSRGSAKGFNRIGVKSVIGHSHSPRIVGGCYQTGTLSLLDLGYNTGPSSWLHSNVVIYANGKRSHLHSIGGSWRIVRKASKRRAA